MISTDYMYASSAFQSEPMESEYLQAMDATEKGTLEKEDKEISEADKKEQNKAGILMSIIMGTITSYLFGMDASARGLKGWDFVKETAPFVGGLSIGGYGLGRFATKDYEIRKKVDLKRADRLDEKIRDIMEKIAIDGKVLEKKEIKELQKAHTFFSNRLFDYKSTRSEKTGGTHIMYQQNQFQKV